MIGRPALKYFIASAVSALSMLGPWATATDEPYGPENLLKTMSTPFGVEIKTPQEDKRPLAPMALGSAISRSLNHRLLAPRLYLPGRLVIGSTAEFIVKGRPGYWAALAMADKNSGAKPIYGHNLRLGPDRKLVSLGKIPEAGVVSLVIDTPVEGDLIGQCLYFEAAVWSKPDFSDIELATPTVSDSAATDQSSNGVLVAAEPIRKRGIRIVPDGMMPMQQSVGQHAIDSGRP